MSRVDILFYDRTDVSEGIDGNGDRNSPIWIKCNFSYDF